jgi:hypothetical protein
LSDENVRTLLLIPASLALTAAGGYGICAALGRSPHVMEMSVALGAVLIASAAGAVPVILARSATQLGMSQAALVGTAVHLLVAISLAAAAILGHFVGGSFLYWLMAFYWVSLIALVAAFARMIRHAAPAPAPKA